MEEILELIKNSSDTIITVMCILYLFLIVVYILFVIKIAQMEHKIDNIFNSLTKIRKHFNIY